MGFCVKKSILLCCVIFSSFHLSNVQMFYLSIFGSPRFLCFILSISVSLSLSLSLSHTHTSALSLSLSLTHLPCLLSLSLFSLPSLSVSLSLCFFLSLSFSLSLFLSLLLSVCLSVCLSVSLSLSLPANICPYIFTILHSNLVSLPYRFPHYMYISCQFKLFIYQFSKKQMSFHFRTGKNLCKQYDHSMKELMLGK